MITCKTGYIFCFDIKYNPFIFLSNNIIAKSIIVIIELRRGQRQNNNLNICLGAMSKQKNPSIEPKICSSLGYSRTPRKTINTYIRITFILYVCFLSVDERKNSTYSPFHKTLTKSSLQIHWISVRFNEMNERNSFNTTLKNNTKY